MSRTRKIVQTAGAVVLALGLAELGFRVRDQGAFPHLRCYAPDAELGLRLEPGRVEKVRFGGAGVTTVRINADGLRGDPLPPPAPDEILVLGDSQAFGLGVEQEQTFAAALGRALARPVQNAGIPTYGPREYALMAERRLDARPAKTVVVVIAFQNDFFEANRANGERHAVWDGWAVRKESAPEAVLQVPGRSLLYRDSHLFYAFRRALHDEAGAGVTRVASGGTLADFVPLSNQVVDAQTAERREREALLRSGEDALREAQKRTDPDALVDMLPEPERVHYVEKRALLRAGTAHPGDIVEDGLGEGEEALSLTATASVIAEGAKLREKLAQQWWAAHGADVESSRTKLLALREQLRQLRVASNPITPSLERIAARCQRAGARLIVVGLPTDTMVSPDAFAKYGEPKVDTAPIAYLADDLRIAAESVGATWIDLLPTLQPLGLAGYLPKEFHLSAQGHEAVAKALAELIPRVELPRPVPPPTLGPFADVVCEGCSQSFEPNAVVDELGILHLGLTDLDTEVLPPNVARSWHELAIDLQPGEALRGHDDELIWTLRRDADGSYRLRPSKPPTPPARGAEDRCTVEAQAMSRLSYSRGKRSATPGRPYLGRGCLREVPATTWGNLNLVGDELVNRVLACASGDPAFTPPCRPGELRLGPAATCRALCDQTHACESGFRCVPFRGASVCAPLLHEDPTCTVPEGFRTGAR